MKLKKGMMVLYGPESPNHLITTQYGQIFWSDYLIKEAARIGRFPDRVAIIEDNCLIVNRVAEDK